MSRTNTPKYLEKMKSGAYRVSIPVPKHLKETLKKTRIKKALATHSLAEASERSHAVISEIIRLFKDVESGKIPSATSAQAIANSWNDTDVVDLALEMRRDLERNSVGTKAYEAALEAIQITTEGLIGDFIGVEVDEECQNEVAVYDEKRLSKGGMFHLIATGKRTPADIKTETFLSLKKWKARTKKDFERAFAMLRDWCSNEKVSFTLETLNRKTVSIFVEHLAADEERKLTHRTINKYISALNQYWVWLEKRGYLKDNELSPWVGQSLEEKPADEDEEERPFTDDELRLLYVKGPRARYLRDAMSIGLLSGARLDAIISLRRKDITDDGCFRFKPQKKETSSRKVPIHSALKDIVERLVAGKKPEDDLFPECPRVAEDVAQERSSPASKAFTRFRRAAGVEEAVAGKKRDLVNFHSFRRTFITKALQANVQLLTVQLVVGHKPQNVTAGTYLGGLTLEQLRECVEAVKLPDGVTL